MNQPPEPPPNHNEPPAASPLPPTAAPPQSTPPLSSGPHSTGPDEPSLVETIREWSKENAKPIILAGLGILGMLIGGVSQALGQWYWLLALGAFAWLGHEMIAAQSDAAAPADEKARNGQLRRQLLHWLGPLLAIQVVLLLQYAGALSDHQGGTTAALVVAVASYAAGLHFDRAFYLVAGLLGAGVLVGSFLREYLWLLVAALALLVAGQWALTRWKRPAKAEQPSESDSPPSDAPTA